MGPESFRQTYKGGRSRDYVALVDGELIDSKPLAASAYRHQFAIKITCADFSGGEQTRRALKPLLEALGHSWVTVSEGRSIATGRQPPIDDARRAYSVEEILEEYGAIDTEFNNIAQSDEGLLLIGFDTTVFAGWNGWSPDASTYTVPVGQRRALDIILGMGHAGRIRVFEVSRRLPGYVDSGEFRLDAHQRYTELGDASRPGQYLVHLSPIDEAAVTPILFANTPQSFETDTKIELVSVENHNASVYEVSGRSLSEADRREADLVSTFSNALITAGHKVGRFKITAQGCISPLFSDLFDVTDNVLYEAKSSPSRAHLRLGLGQILDYRRYLDASSPRAALLVPQEPQRDMLDLLVSYGVWTVWPGGDGAYIRFTENDYEVFPLHEQKTR
ncbi:hypothetical protein [Arthrobacter sp. 35/47]|uniref:hypothetical protein n=1 Tax=Arthrobacter sp. 35/47 TaxID=269454 RepID=UPI00047AB124|nr:hypothetical protein [Arthrobacter sp. 35/47]